MWSRTTHRQAIKQAQKERKTGCSTETEAKQKVNWQEKGQIMTCGHKGGHSRCASTGTDARVGGTVEVGVKHVIDSRGREGGT